MSRAVTWIRENGEPLAWLVWPLAMCAAYLSTLSTRYVVNDVLSASLAAWRIATTGTPWFDDFPLAEVDVKGGQELWTGEASNGHVAVFRSPGAIAVAVPGYAIRRVLGSGGTDVSDFSILPAALTAVVVTVASLLLFALALRPVLGGPRALLAVTVLGVATPVWTVSAEALWPHTLTVFSIAGMAYAASRDRWLLAGFFGGLGLWGRLHVSLVVAVLGLGTAAARRSPGPAIRVGLVSALLMGLAAVWSHWMYGEWDPAGGYAGVSTYAENAAEQGRLDQLVNELGLWISPGRGLLVLTPCVLLLAPAVVRGWGQTPDWVRSLFAAGILYSVVQGLMNVFAGGAGFFGYRLTLETLACMFPALVLCTRFAGPVARMLLPPVLVVQAGWFAFGAAVDGFTMAPSNAWRISSVAWAASTIPAFGIMLVLLAALTVLVCRMLPATWAWPREEPSAAEETRQRA